MSPFGHAVSEADLRRMVWSVDDALRILRAYEGRLTPRQIRILSMLNVVQQELGDELFKEIADKAQQTSLGLTE